MGSGELGLQIVVALLRVLSGGPCQHFLRFSYGGFGGRLSDAQAAKVCHGSRLSARSVAGSGLLLGEPCLTARLLLRFFPGQPRLAELKAVLGVFRFGGFDAFMPNTLFGGAVVLHQRDRAGANVAAGTALNAVEQMVSLKCGIVFGTGVPVQLLGKQLSRAHTFTSAAANAGGFRGCWRQLLFVAAIRQLVVLVTEASNDLSGVPIIGPPTTT